MALMTLTEAEKRTVEYYNHTGREWVSKHGGEASQWEEEMKGFMKFLPKGYVFEIGVGAGKEAKMLMDAGYGYTGIDPSESLLEIAQEVTPHRVFYNGSVYDIHVWSDCPFDGFWAAASLLHVPKVRIDEALQNVNRATRKGGIGFISMKEGVGEIEDETGRTFSYYSQPKFNKILERNGFSILERAKRSEGSLTWLLYYVSKI